MKNILNIIKNSNYSFSLFDQKLIDELENKITMQYSVVNLDKTITTLNFRLDAEFYRPFCLEDVLFSPPLSLNLQYSYFSK